jgi:hypothetical protein
MQNERRFWISISSTINCFKQLRDYRGRVAYSKFATGPQKLITNDLIVINTEPFPNSPCDPTLNPYSSGSARQSMRHRH